MQTVSLSYQHSFELAAVLAVTGAALAVPQSPRAKFAGAFLRETAVIGVLYGLWQLAGRLSGLSVLGAHARAEWIRRFEHDIGLPAERSVQHLILGHPSVVQVANLYYATMHFTMMFVFLIWLFVRHRDRYKPVRTVLAWTTLACLIVQFVPVAPPRMLPGIVDTGMRYGQSVYQGGFAVDQLSAMPSVHVAWAMLVGYYSWRVSVSGWRYLGWTHSASRCSSWWPPATIGGSTASSPPCCWR